MAASAENERSLSFGLTGPASLVSEDPEQSESNPYEIARIGQSPAGQSPAGQSPAGQSPAGQSPAGQSPTGQSEKGAETAWWGKAFLKACPLH